MTLPLPATSEQLLPRTTGPAVMLGDRVARFQCPDLTSNEDEIVQRFSKLYYEKLDEGRGLHTVVLSWMGHELFKCPTDMWTYQELVFANRYDLIVETGTYKGGSAHFLACMCELVGNGEVISIDIDDSHSGIRPQHPRLTYLLGSSTDPAIIDIVSRQSASFKNILIILDSDHCYDHVLQELRSYQSLVPPGGLIVVEDTNINGHPAYEAFGPGPWEAVDAFLAESPQFSADRSLERFLLTMNPRGFLRRSL